MKTETMKTTTQREGANGWTILRDGEEIATIERTYPTRMDSARGIVKDDSRKCFWMLVRPGQPTRRMSGMDGASFKQARDQALAILARAEGA